MNVFEAILKRRSIRAFDPTKTITNEQIEKLLEAARWAPSAGNKQDWYFVVVKDQKVRSQLAAAALGQESVAQAPVVIVACADFSQIRSRYGERGEELYTIQDVALATYNIWLTATEMGLGAVWIGAFDEKEAAKILDLSQNLRPLALLPFGYPTESPSPPPRRSIAEISQVI